MYSLRADDALGISRASGLLVIDKSLVHALLLSCFDHCPACVRMAGAY